MGDQPERLTSLIGWITISWQRKVNAIYEIKSNFLVIYKLAKYLRQYYKTQKMRKYLLLLLITTLGFGACKKEVLVTNDTLANQTILKYVSPNQWEPSPDGQTLTVTLPVSQIDRATFENDDISVMISRGDNDTYEKIPFVYDAQTYSYDITPGYVTLYIQTSGDQNLIPVAPTTNTRVKIVLITSSL